MAIDIKKLLSDMPGNVASDLHLRVGMPPVYRIHGALTKAERQVVTIDDMAEILKRILTPQQVDKYKKEKELDFALQLSPKHRYRVNLYKQRGTPALAFRLINLKVPTFEELHLPRILEKLSLHNRGMLLVTGVTGSGKSTSLAAMIDYINNNRSLNIITVEDPIEYVFHNRRSIIAQRELGEDTISYASALIHALRQDPDVILMGEIRDAETMSTALAAADTGHLVLSTLHTLDSLQTIYRILSFFPPHQHQEVRMLLASTLRAVISQRLIPRDDRPGRVPAVEILIGTAAVQEYIIDEMKTPGVRDLIAEGSSQYGMQSFDQSLMSFFKKKMISLQTAIENATNPDDFKLRVEGFMGGADRGWKEFEEHEESIATSNQELPEESQ